MTRGLLAAAIAALAFPAAAEAGCHHAHRLHGAYYFSYGQGQHGDYHPTRADVSLRSDYRAGERVLVQPAHYVFGRAGKRAAEHDADHMRRPSDVRPQAERGGRRVR